MKRVLIYSIVCFFAGLLLQGCESRVRAGREGEPETYQPRPSPQQPVIAPEPHSDVKGELMRVDLKNNTIMVRAQNGMEQTFKFNDQTMVQGLEKQGVRSLIGKEGSEITVSWKEEAGAKMATMIDVNDLVSKKNKR
jgi:hypothetical protein